MQEPCEEDLEPIREPLRSVMRRGNKGDSHQIWIRLEV